VGYSRHNIFIECVHRLIFIGGVQRGIQEIQVVKDVEEVKG
jgi:hypothetical protein